jgi:hypothetical protein
MALGRGYMAMSQREPPEFKLDENLKESRFNSKDRLVNCLSVTSPEQSLLCTPTLLSQYRGLLYEPIEPSVCGIPQPKRGAWQIVKWEHAHGTAKVHGNGALAGTCSYGVRTSGRSHGAKE